VVGVGVTAPTGFAATAAPLVSAPKPGLTNADNSSAKITRFEIIVFFGVRTVRARLWRALRQTSVILSAIHDAFVSGSYAALERAATSPTADQALALSVNSKGRTARASPARTNRPVSSIQPLGGRGTAGVKVIINE
jgi:hypothetical protein